MTESEAKQKWCPMVRYLAVFTAGDGSKSGGGYNRGADHPATTAKCIGSECMMWRWQLSPHQVAQAAARGATNETPTGHCGLAGKP